MTVKIKARTLFNISIPPNTVYDLSTCNAQLERDEAKPRGSNNSSYAHEQDDGDIYSDLVDLHLNNHQNKDDRKSVNFSLPPAVGLELIFV